MILRGHKRKLNVYTLFVGAILHKKRAAFKATLRLLTNPSFEAGLCHKKKDFKFSRGISQILCKLQSVA